MAGRAQGRRRNASCALVAAALAAGTPATSADAELPLRPAAPGTPQRGFGATTDRPGFAVLRQDGRVVGAVRVRRLDDRTAELGMLSVDPAAMGTGAGRALLEFAERRHGTPFMQLELLVPRAPHAHKQRLHDWYSRLGYVQIGEREFDEPLLAGPAVMRTYRKRL